MLFIADAKQIDLADLHVQGCQQACPTQSTVYSSFSTWISRRFKQHLSSNTHHFLDQLSLHHNFDAVFFCLTENTESFERLMDLFLIDKRTEKDQASNESPGQISCVDIWPEFSFVGWLEPLRKDQSRIEKHTILFERSVSFAQAQGLPRWIDHCRWLRRISCSRYLDDFIVGCHIRHRRKVYLTVSGQECLHHLLRAQLIRLRKV